MGLRWLAQDRETKQIIIILQTYVLYENCVENCRIAVVQNKLTTKNLKGDSLKIDFCHAISVCDCCCRLKGTQ